MKFDYESLSAEPLFYMLMHSGKFVSVLGGVFFILGLLFGFATWGRFKRQTRELRSEAEAMKDEIAQLKRKIGDHSVKSGQVIAIATETIHMPAKEVAVSKPSASAPSQPPATKNRQPKLSLINSIKPKPVVAEAPSPVAKTVAPAAPPPAAAAKPITTSIPLPPATEPPPPPAPSRHTSPLAAIVAAPPPDKKDSIEGGESSPAVPAGLIPADTIPTLTTELPPAAVPTVAAVAQPVLDSHLGLVYKTRPEKMDDLTELKGIAKVLEQRLHEFGVYTYAQIASWSEDQIREFSTRLAFKDRIQRERWVEQAQHLLAKKTQHAA